MTDEQEESTRRPTSECRGRGGEHTGQERDQDGAGSQGEVFIRVGLVDGNG